MGEWDYLYEFFKITREKQKRDNFNAFMTGLNNGLVDDLNKAWASGDIDKYYKLVNNVKKQGIRVFRNGEGMHKLQY